jgi:hypothetical protein
MARARNIKPGFFLMIYWPNRSTGRLLFAGLWTIPIEREGLKIDQRK